MTRHESPETVASPSAWTSAAVRRPGAAVRLYCVPFLGGSADFFLPLAHELPDWVETRPLELPGYGRRLREPAVRDLPALVRSLAAAVHEDAAGGPYAFFGHCGGGLLAFEATRLLRRQSRPQPSLLAASSTHPPHRWRQLVTTLKAEPLHRMLPIVAELAAQHTLQKAGVQALTKREVAAYLRYRYEDGPPLDCPISVFGGREDPLIRPPALGAWTDLSTGRVRNRIYPGRHFYLTDHWPDVAQSLAHDLGRALRSPASPAEGGGGPVAGV